MPTEVEKTALDTFDISRIMKMIPHRYPFLMIDRVIDVVSGESATGIKNVTINEPFFQGHFPDHPVMPGVLIIESMAQTAAVLVIHTLGEQAEGTLVYFTSIDQARFRRPIGPGDSVRIDVEKRHNRGSLWKFKGEASVNGTLVAEATFAAMTMEDS